MFILWPALLTGKHGEGLHIEYPLPELFSETESFFLPTVYPQNKYLFLRGPIFITTTYLICNFYWYIIVSVNWFFRTSPNINFKVYCSSPLAVAKLLDCFFETFETVKYRTDTREEGGFSSKSLSCTKISSLAWNLSALMMHKMAVTHTACVASPLPWWTIATIIHGYFL